MKDKETDFQTEDLSKIVTKLIAGVGIAMSVYHLYTGYFGAPEAFLHRSIHLFFTMTLIFFLCSLFPRKTGRKNIAGPMGCPCSLTWASIGYIFHQLRVCDHPLCFGPPAERSGYDLRDSVDPALDRRRHAG